MPRRWSLRTLFVAIAIICIAFAVIALYRDVTMPVEIDVKGGTTRIGDRGWFDRNSNPIVMRKVYRYQHARDFQVTAEFANHGFNTTHIQVKPFTPNRKDENGNYCVEFVLTVYASRIEIEQYDESGAAAILAWSQDFSPKGRVPAGGSMRHRGGGIGMPKQNILCPRIKIVRVCL
jgi:hypothetical protein